ncbi:hypothetical protein F0249_12700 [Vibrio sp. 03-59-1]|uniref:hypothetical protein n=1 Tax=Vibrio sp. 03-59-1 TaxID=2607607 RepID=UPI0014936DFF|nr:hypothetical protein [Vibrio sp. 03-59-1]NOH84675.1 hypothetical protein [Vibrio sp. 03-59-1]
MKKLIALAVATSLLTACGGGSSNTTPTTPTTPAAKVGGTAIDGYITGGVAYIDYNFNGKLDAGEPSAITGDKGTFDITPTGQYADCADYAPVMIDVPVGAIDSDFGEVTEAYQLVHPPVFATPGYEDTRNTTPLTTLVWNSISRELQGDDSIKNCADLKANVGLRESIGKRVEQQAWNIAHRYGITVDELYSDFIAEGNDKVHQLAIDIVPSLQKSFEETKTLSDANPNANYVGVEYYLGRWDWQTQALDNKWYREEYVYSDNGWTREIAEYAEDLTTKIAVIFKADATVNSDNTSGVSYEMLREYDLIGTQGHCSVNEYIKQARIFDGGELVGNTGTLYGVRNLANGDVADISECDGFDFISNIDSRMLLTNSQTGEMSEHLYFGTGLVGYDNLLNLSDTYQNLGTSDFAPISVIPTDFNDDGDYGADIWLRSKFTENAEGLQVLLTRNNSGKWTRSTTQVSGIHTIECSNDGSVWTEAETLRQCSEM